MAPYKNPYHPVDPDMEERFDGRQSVLDELQRNVLNVVHPSCLSVVAERGMGGKAAVRKFLQTNQSELSFRIVECDIKFDLEQGNSATDFYRSLVQFIAKQLGPLSSEVHRIANRITTNQSSKLNDIKDDFWEFFELLREQDPTKPLLIVFYTFDELPKIFPFKPLEWTFLTQLHNQFITRLYYLVVSRRPLRFIEDLHSLQHSRFSTIFSPTIIRVDLLKEEEARELIVKPARSMVGGAPWPEWLEKQILEWGGGNPHCLECICFHLFSKIWIQKQAVSPENVNLLARIIGRELKPFFDRLFENLSKDKLLDLLLYALESGHSAAHSDQITELVDLGYFLPEPAEHKKYQLFSPLFHDYLMQRDIITPRPQDKHVVQPEELPDKLDENKINSPIEPLSEREIEVLQLMERGLTNPQIAEKLVIALDTVKAHSKNIFQKLGVNKRILAVQEAKRLNLL